MILNRRLLTILLIGLIVLPGGSLFAHLAPTGPAPTVDARLTKLMDVTIKRKKKKKKRRRRRSRRYTLRGNPEVTRKVATQLLVEKLPELARLVDLDVPETPTETSADVVLEDSEDPTASVPGSSNQSVTIIVPARSEVSSTSPSPVPGDGYDDSEYSEEEDPDQLTAEDEDLLNLDDEEDLTIENFYKDFTDYMATLNGETYITDNGIDMEIAMENLMEWLGTRYLFGGTTKKGIDCSAFTRTMYRSIGYPLPRTAVAQWDTSEEEVEYDDLQFGDLVFFNTRSAVYVSHVGIYLGNGMFAHASSRNGVTVSSLESNYYSTHFIGARRYDVAGTIAEAEEKEEMEVRNEK